MLTVELNQKEGIAVLEPHGRLSESDFAAAASKIDPFIEKSGSLNGVIIRVSSFPGWESFAALVKHLKFVRDHHKKVTRLAIVTESPIGELAEHVANHFVQAEIRHFSQDDMELAKQWISGAEHD